MSKKDTKKTLRAPIALLDHRGGARYYSEDDINRILIGRKLKPDFDRARFTKHLEGLAFHCVFMDSQKRGTPSARERFFDSLEQRTNRLIETIAKGRSEIEHALRDDPELSGQDPWSSIEQVTACLQKLTWLKSTAVQGKAKSAIEKTERGGNTQRLAPRFFIAEAMKLAELSFDENLKFGRPEVFDETRDDDLHSTFEAKGSAIDFLETCLRPLKYEGSPRSIYEILLDVWPRKSR